MSSYPLITARVGSIIQGGKISLQRVIAGKTTEFRSGGEGNTFVSGSSRYVHNEKMNKGSFSLQGAYGVSGVSRVSAAVSGHIGNAAAESGKTLDLKYNVYTSAGIEYLKIERLSVKDFIMALERNPRNRLISALEKYNHLSVLMQQEGAGSKQLLNGSEENDELVRAFKDWSSEVQHFLEFYGEGFVAAVHWGAIGNATLKIKDDARQNAWSYGGDGEFSYASVGAAVSASAAYEGAEERKNKNVSIDIVTSYLGNALADTIRAWEGELKKLSYEELGKVNTFDKLSGDYKAPMKESPKIPEFVQPKSETEEEKEAEDKLAKGLKLKGKKESDKDMAAAKAIEEERAKSGKDLSPKEFAEATKKKTDTKPLEEIEMEVYNPQYDDIVDDEYDYAPRAINTLATGAIQNRILGAKDSADQGEDAGSQFIPLGVLIVQWTDLFPWLASYTNNELNGMEKIREIIRWRSMIQDFQMLSAIYYIADSVSVYPTEEGFTKEQMEENKMEYPGDATLLQLGDIFASQSVALQSVGPKEDYSEIMRKAYQGLSPTAKVIYNTWVRNPHLRRAELGMGASIISNERRESLKEIGSKGYRGHYKSQYVQTGKCEVDVEHPNLVAFSRFMKLTPIIMPNGVITAFGSHGYFGKRSNESTFPWYFCSKFRDTSFKAVVLSGKPDQDFFTDKHTDDVFLFPIPFSTAKGLRQEGSRWRGASIGAASLASFEDLTKNIEQVKKELSDLRTFSLTGENNSFPQDFTDLGMNELHVQEHYIGVVPQEKLMKLFTP